MNLSKYLYQVFLLSILVPGLILAYLSFRTVKDERILIEKSLENRNTEFVGAVQGVLEKTKSEHFARLQEQLQRSSSTSSPDNYLFLATDLLENSLVQSLAIFYGDDMVFPRRLLYQDSLGIGNDIKSTSQSATAVAANAIGTGNTSTLNTPGMVGTAGIIGFTPSVSILEDDSLEIPVKAQEFIAVIQVEYRQGRYLHALRLIRTFNHMAEGLYATRAGSLYRYGLWQLEIKCLIGLNLTEEAVGQGRELIQALLRGNGFASYHQVHFYLTSRICRMWRAPPNI